MTDYVWDFDPVIANLPALLTGLGVTLKLTGLAIVIGTPLGILYGIALRIEAGFIRVPLYLTMDAVRSLPILILILWIYYFVPVMIGFPQMGAFWLALIALTINLAAFIADVVRASLAAYPQGLKDAAYACGLSEFATMRHIVIPGVVREILPTLSLLYIDVLKLSSLASVIAVNELLHTADRVRANTFQVIEVFTVVALIYLIIVMPLSFLVRSMEQNKYFRRRS